MGGNMRLRNKKTGEIIESEYMMLVQITSTKGERNLLFDDLAELNSEWEDCKPAEPLIKDPKARKVFREWAEFFGTESFRVEHLCKYGRTIITSTDLVSEPVIELPGYIGEDSEIYTKVELGGEEK